MIKQLKEKISSLQLMSGIEREQTKYLTENVNKTLYKYNGYFLWFGLRG